MLCRMDAASKGLWCGMYERSFLLNSFGFETRQWWLRMWTVMQDAEAVAEAACDMYCSGYVLW